MNTQVNKYGYKRKVKTFTNQQFREMLKDYIRKEFHVYSKYEATLERLEVPLQDLILCDRYNKGEAIIEGCNFETIRNLLQKFNTRNLL